MKIYEVPVGGRSAGPLRTWWVLPAFMIEGTDKMELRERAEIKSFSHPKFMSPLNSSDRSPSKTRGPGRALQPPWCSFVGLALHLKSPVSTHRGPNEAGDQVFRNCLRSCPPSLCTLRARVFVFLLWQVERTFYPK